MASESPYLFRLPHHATTATCLRGPSSLLVQMRCVNRVGETAHLPTALAAPAVPAKYSTAKRLPPYHGHIHSAAAFEAAATPTHGFRRDQTAGVCRSNSPAVGPCRHASGACRVRPRLAKTAALPSPNAKRGPCAHEEAARDSPNGENSVGSARRKEHKPTGLWVPMSYKYHHHHRRQW